MKPSKAVKEYKDENTELKAKIDEYAKKPIAVYRKDITVNNKDYYNSVCNAR